MGFSGHVNWEKINYLGLPLTLGVNKTSLWQEILRKIKKKIVGWGSQWLTNAGEVILIKSVLSALPIYQASFLLAPKYVTEHVSKLLRDFLWHG